MRTRRLLIVILVLSFALRVILACKGGQDFWPDESRYERAQYAVSHAAHGEWRQAADWLLGHADHLLFTWWGLPPALWGYLFGRNLPLAAAYFGLFSTLAIYLVWRVARRAGAGEREALIAAFLAACANSLFYYSRHLFPYDIALCLVLTALWLALGPWSWWRSLLSGVAAGVGFLTYNGYCYWLPGACVLAMHVLLGDGGWRRLAGRAALAGIGLVTPIGLMIGLAHLAGHDLIQAFRSNAGTVTQGDFRMGWLVILEYFRYAEGWLFLLWLAGGLGALVVAAIHVGHRDRIHWWVGIGVLLLAGLILFSDVIPKFVVYGRLARTLAPFFCLATACMIERLAVRRTVPRRAWVGGAAIVVWLAAWNFAGPLTQIFPADFQRLAREIVFGRQKSGGWDAYRLLFAEALWYHDVRLDLPPHEVLVRRAHPLQYRPYQYEGFSRMRREEVNAHDVSMRLIRLTGVYGGRNPATAGGVDRGGYPGPVRMRLKFSAQEPGVSQPIVTTGRVGLGDFLFYIPDDKGQLRFGYDNWGGSHMLSEPVTLDFERVHELLISFGSLFPPELKASGKFGRLHDYLLLELDGQSVLARRALSHEVAPETITFGANLIGGSAAGQLFRGSIERIDPENLTEVAQRFGPLMPGYASSLRPAAWNGAPGPLRLKLRLQAEFPPGTAQPLLSFGSLGDGDALFWLRDEDGRVRVGIDSVGDGAVYSEPFSVDSRDVHEVLVSIGSMMPPAESPFYADNPGALRLRGMLFVSINDRIALSLQRPFHARPNETVFTANTIGSAVAGPLFMGKLIDVTAASPEEVMSASVQLARMIGDRPDAWGGYPGPVGIKLRFPEHWQSESEPLIVSGATGAGDLLVMRRQEDGRIQFALDHWGGAPVFSPPVAAAPDIDHEVVVSLGSLMPPEGSELYREQPRARILLNVLSLNIDGQPLFAQAAEFHPSLTDQIVLGVNSIGGSTAGPALSAQVLAIRGVSVDEIRRITPLPFLKGPPPRDAAWLSYPGPVAIRLVMPLMTPGEAAPLVCTGSTGAGDLLFVRREADGSFRFGLDHWGNSNLLLSDPVVLAPGKEHLLVVSLPSLMPPAGAGVYAVQPELQRLRETIQVELDGRIVWRTKLAGFATQPSDIIYGANFIGASTSGRLFKGDIKEITTISPQQVLKKAEP